MLGCTFTVYLYCVLYAIKNSKQLISWIRKKPGINHVGLYIKIKGWERVMIIISLWNFNLYFVLQRKDWRKISKYLHINCSKSVFCVAFTHTSNNAVLHIYNLRDESFLVQYRIIWIWNEWFIVGGWGGWCLRCWERARITFSRIQSHSHIID